MYVFLSLRLREQCFTSCVDPVRTALPCLGQLLGIGVRYMFMYSAVINIAINKLFIS